MRMSKTVAEEAHTILNKIRSEACQSQIPRNCTLLITDILFIPMQGHVCGLCGNYDGNGNNDFTTRSQSVVGNVLEFANSWKVSSTCPNANQTKDPCTANPYRKSWAQKQCSIITSEVFAKCHSQVWYSFSLKFSRWRLHNFFYAGQLKMRQDSDYVTPDKVK